MGGVLGDAMNISKRMGMGVVVDLKNLLEEGGGSKETPGANFLGTNPQ